MHFTAQAIVCVSRPHGETAAIVRLLTQDHGLVAGYVAGGRGRQLRPVLVPGNVVEAELRARVEGQLPYAKLELVSSRGPWLGEPLPAAAIGWATSLTAAALPERHAYPPLYPALAALLDAVCHAPSARGWLPGLLAYEALLLRELGYGEIVVSPASELSALLAEFDALGQRLDRYPLAERRTDVMGARAMLRERLARIG
jgi:DNA repair protein RecO (recombination protein O)